MMSKKRKQHDPSKQFDAEDTFDTPKQLNAYKAAPKGKRYFRMHTARDGFGVVVTDDGTKTFFLNMRFAIGKPPARRTIGTYEPTGSVREARLFTLADARTRADEWREEVRKGLDPRDEERKRRLENERKRANTFASMAEDFIAQKLPGERKGKEVERDIRRDLIPDLGSIALPDMKAADIRPVIKAKARSAPAQARNLLGIVKRMMQWAADEEAYGIETSPAASLKAGNLVGGPKLTGTRILADDELSAFWRATGRLPYPIGPAYRMLALTALRLNEAADAAWAEFDPAVVRELRTEEPDWSRVPRENRAWTIPAERMKGKNGEARAHIVPLTDDILGLLASLPKIKGAKFVFSFDGKKPVWITSKVKERLDSRMLRTLKARARVRGDDASAVSLPAWRNHDIRRTVRSGLSRLKIEEQVREAVLAHVPPGIKKNYDLHDYFEEKAEALALWANRLKAIASRPVTPGGNVVPLWKEPLAAAV